ncbi:MAG TPA: 3-deoxy-D-manno-octulosonic acid kinase [Candidatus Synoicihabitans sp.]|nr:3-deoxy-D-manno-octulosonic acid kinase [Candidatus Synoicihabitans sp.]
MPVQFLHLPTGAALFDPEEVSSSTLTELLAQGLAQSSTPLANAAGREGVRVIKRARQPWVWRHNRRGGWCGKFVRDSYVWLGAQRTRAFQEWRLLHHLRNLGLPVPAPVAALYERRGIIYQSDIITGLLPNTETLSARLRSGPVPLSAWQAVGQCIRRFHSHGIHHADLNAHNILLDSEDRIYLIDFDRGAIRSPGRWIEGNWARLRRSLDKLNRALPAGRFGETEWTALRTE